MRKLAQRFVVVLLLSSIGLLTSCKEEQVEVRKPLKRSKRDTRLPEEVYPFKRPLTNQQGKTIDAIVIAKTDTTVTIRKQMRGETFVYQIESLAADDQEFLATLPNGDFGKIESLQMDVARVEKQIADIEAKIANKLSNPQQHPKMRLQVKELTRELLMLKDKLEKASVGDGYRKRR